MGHDALCPRHTELSQEAVDLLMISWVTRDGATCEYLSCYLRVPLSWLEAGEAEAELR